MRSLQWLIILLLLNNTFHEEKDPNTKLEEKAFILLHAQNYDRFWPGI